RQRTPGCNPRSAPPDQRTRRCSRPHGRSAGIESDAASIFPRRTLGEAAGAACNNVEARKTRMAAKVSFRVLAGIASQHPNLGGENDADHDADECVSPHTSLRERRLFKAEQ